MQYKKVSYLLGILILSLPTTTLFAQGTFISIDANEKKVRVNSGVDQVSLDMLRENSTPPLLEIPNHGKRENTFNQKVSTQEQSTNTPPAKDPNSVLYAELNEGTESEKAIYRMFLNGLTQYQNIDDYRPHDPLLREEAAKIIGQAYKVLDFPDVLKSQECTFSDEAEFNPGLKDFILTTCKHGIFKGNQGKFLAKKSLSKAEALTVLIRILEGKSTELEVHPRWTYYFIKARSIFLTNETDVYALNKEITREEIALLIYRFKKIVLDQQIYATAKAQIEGVNNNPQAYIKEGKPDPQTRETPEQIITPQQSETPAEISKEVEELLSSTTPDHAESLSILNSPELNEAVEWMKDVGITNAKDTVNFDPFSLLTRGHAAKMFDQFAKEMKLTPIEGSKSSCIFNDLRKISSDLHPHIKNACALGIMQGNKGNFEPQVALNKAQFITMLVRLAEGKKLDESTTPWRSNYFLKAKELGIINNNDAPSFERPLTRYEAALLFYRFQVKQKISSNINTDKLKNELISTVKDANGEYIKKENSYSINIDSNLLKNQYFQGGYIELLGSRYTVKKTNITTFNIGEESFVWYGDLIDIAKDTKVGSLNLIVSNGYIIDGSIRIPEENKHYEIKEDPATSAWYQLIVKN